MKTSLNLKRWLTLFMAVFTMVSSIPMDVFAAEMWVGSETETTQEVVMQGEDDNIDSLNIMTEELTENDIQWTYSKNEDDTITLTGFENEDLTGDIVIPGTIDGYTVTAIGDKAFIGTSAMSYTIPEGVKSIGANAFEYCYELISVDIPSSVEKIGEYAFWSCFKLNSIVIPDGVTRLEESVFSVCSSLEEVVIPESVTFIGDSVFFSCESLTSLKFPGTIISLGEYAFYSCSKLESIEMTSENVTSIGKSTFYECINLKEIPHFEHIESIGEDAFYKCTNLQKIFIPESLKEIADNVFSECTSLKTAGPVGSGCNVEFAWKNKIPFNSFFGFESLETIEIPNEIYEIEGYAFHGCTSLKEVTIPNSVVKIGASAFNSCEALEIINYRGTQEQWNNILIEDYNTSLDNAQINYDKNAEDLENIEINAENFPDTSFRDALLKTSEGEDTIFNIYELASITYLNLSYNEIQSLEGIHFFENLKSLDCDYNNLTELPTLPEGLERLGCEDNNLNSLPELPKSLIYLDCGGNENLTSIPTLPDGLIMLNCEENQLASLPELPSTLEELNCSYNQIKQLPKLPENLEWLKCSHNNITSLPELPESLTILECTGNNITMLSKLPQSLTELECSSCDLSSLPELPKSLIYLSCVYNNLTKLPELPDTLEILSCDNNELSELPKLPASLKQLYCSYNYLSDVELNAEAAYEYIDLRYNTIEDQNLITGNDAIVWDEENQWGGIDFEFSPQRIIEISSIEVKRLPYKIEYFLGEELDVSGLVVEATYSDGNKKDVENYVVSGYHPDKIGVQSIVITCGDYTTEFVIEVFDEEYKDDINTDIIMDSNNIICAGDIFSSVVTENGDLYSWGANYYGEVGNGSTKKQLVPVKILTDVIDVQAGNWYSAALTKNKDLYLWGYNRYGQIGNGTQVDQKTPIKILSNVQSFSISTLHSAAITENGDLYVWGWNSYGQIGNGEQTNQLTPFKVLSDVAYVSTGNSHTAAITKSGDLYVWGNGWSGQIGNGTSELQLTPVKVLSNVVSVDLGSAHSAAITRNGDLYMWGNGGYGRLGTGNDENELEPVKILSNVKEVVLNANAGISAAITQNGSLYLWGENWLNGAIGNGTKDDQYTPYKVLSNVEKVDFVTSQVVAVTKNGELYTWGSNEHGEIGNGTKKEQLRPVKILSNVEEVGINTAKVGAITKDGSVYFWGENNNGEIGDGTTKDRLTPTKIMETKVPFEIEEIQPQEYTGAQIKPTPVVTEDGVALQYGKDYTLSYKNNTKVGNAQIIIKGKGNYTKTITTEFEIVAKPLSDEDISVTCTDKLYNGKKQVSKPVVKWGKNTLKSGTDYTVEYSENQISVGEVKVTITGKGNYTGTVETTYRITDKSISKTVMDKISTQYYTGEAIEPNIVLYANKAEQKKGNSLELNKDYKVAYENNIFAGKGKITVTGIGEFGGTKTVTFTISKCNIFSDNIDISFVTDGAQEDFAVTYTGKAQKPEIVVMDGETILEVGKDYSLSYSNNTVAAGTASKKKPTVTVKGLGDYSGTKKIYFNILPQDLGMAEDLEVTVADARYTGKAVKPSVTLKLNGKTLKKGTDYKILSYENNVKLCEKNVDNGAYVRIEGIKNYTGEIQESFRIYSGNASGFLVDKIAAQEYTPYQKIEPEIVVYANKTDKNEGIALIEGTDYEVDYQNNEKAGTAKAIIIGIGEYGGTKTVTFTIGKRKFTTQDSLTQVYLEIQSDNMTYTGNALKPEVTVMDGLAVELIEGVDYTLSYSNNKNVATNSKKQPTVTVKGKGNYTGTLSQKFVIEPKNIADESIEVVVNDALFNQKKADSKNGITTTVTVKDGTKKLSTSNYKISSYLNNKTVGDDDDENAPTVVLEGKGNYTGTLEVPFRIYKTAISKATVAKISSVLYTGKTLEPKPDLTLKVSKNETITLVEGEDYTLSWENNVKIGKGKVIITGIGEYGGSKTVTFTILPKWLKWF